MKECDINEIFTEMKDAPNKEGRALIERAYAYAEKAHTGQFRSSGAPYFTHVFATAKNLARYEMDPTTIAAGLMHDVIEDTSVSEEEFEKEFGPEILFLVTSVSKLGKLKYKGHERHVESLRKFFIALAKDFRVLVIKLADRLHNLQTLEYVKPEKRARIALESIEVYAPLADRLGMGKLKGEIEDAAFPYAFPKESEMIDHLLREKVVASTAHLEKIKDMMIKEFEKQHLTVKKIDYRVKHRYSLWKKLAKYKMDIDKIYDIMALRIVVDSVEDCYRILGLVHTVWKPLPGRIKDYIALPKPNGYQSIHTTVFTGDGGIVEIQIRTVEMHGRAEYGIASHFAYKERTEEKIEDKKFAWDSKLRELEHATGNQEDFLGDLKKDFFTNRIFIFTPQGDVIDLPEDSSPIDFAYAVHSEVGNTCASVKVNRKLVPLSTKLQSGDIVEILTNKNAKPVSKWLDFVKTSMARKHISAYLKANDKGLLSRFLSFGGK